MSRNSQVTRILRVLQILESHPQGVRAIEIFSQLNREGYKCVRETVYRDLSALQGAYIPLINEGSGEGANWRLDANMKLSAFLTLSYPEIMSLYLAREQMRTENGSYIIEALQNMFQKIETALGPRATEAIKELSGDVGFKIQPGWFKVVSQDTVNTIHHACAEGQMLGFRYASLNANSDPQRIRKVGPDGLYLANGGAYLVGREYPTMQRKTFALDRIADVEIHTDHYASEEGFEIGKVFENQWGVLSTGLISEVRILIDEPVASFVMERFWHSSQKIRRLDSGRIQFVASVNINDEFVRWVLSLGSAATVESPDILRDAVREASVAIQRRYDRKSA